MAAIFKNDSSWATAGVGKRLNNPSNLRCLSDNSPVESECIPSPGNGYFSKFKNLRDGTHAAVDMYVRHYAGRTASEITRIWAGDPESPGYWTSIKACF